MSRRLLIPTGAAALALVLATPTAALADDHGKNGDHGKSGDHGSSSEHGKSSSHSHDQSTANDQGGSGRSGGDPAGNNGTIKIDYAAPADSGHANRPHPGCAFQLRMFDFDANQYGTITFVGQAPTKLGTLLTQPHMLLSNDAAGGGQDVDQVYSYTAAQLGLPGKPQAKQGWHIKVSVDADNAPGGAKQKVFWLKCATPSGQAAEGANESVATPQGESSQSATESTTTTGTAAGAAIAGAPLAGAASKGAATGAALAAAGGPAAAGTTTGFTGGAASAVSGRSVVRPANRGSALPFTGVALGTMLTVALGALVAGALAIRAGRRRTAQV